MAQSGKKNSKFATEPSNEPTPALSPPRQNGRRLCLKFLGNEKPQLDRIEFQWNAASKPTYWQQGDSQFPMAWTKLPQALALLFLDYVTHPGSVGSPTLCKANGNDLPIALCNAISERTHKLHALFADESLKSKVSRTRQIFGGHNLYGDKGEERTVFVLAETLPTDCVEVYWMFYGQERITDVGVFREIANRIRKDLGIPIGEAIPIKAKEPVQPTTPPPSAPPVTSPPPPLPTIIVQVPPAP